MACGTLWTFEAVAHVTRGTLRIIGTKSNGGTDTHTREIIYCTILAIVSTNRSIRTVHVSARIEANSVATDVVCNFAFVHTHTAV